MLYIAALGYGGSIHDPGAINGATPRDKRLTYAYNVKCKSLNILYVKYHP